MNQSRATGYAVGQLQRIGRELVAGSWSRGAEPMSGEAAIATMARALAVVAERGAAAVIDALRTAVRRKLTGGLVHPLGCTCMLCDAPG